MRKNIFWGIDDLGLHFFFKQWPGPTTNTYTLRSYSLSFFVFLSLRLPLFAGLLTKRDRFRIQRKLSHNNSIQYKNS
jgi:hypothetical protein